MIIKHGNKLSTMPGSGIDYCRCRDYRKRLLIELGVPMLTAALQFQTGSVAVVTHKCKHHINARAPLAMVSVRIMFAL